MKTSSRMKRRIKILLFTVLAIGIVSILILIFTTIKGEGPTFMSISATFETKKAFKYIKAGKYEKAAKYIGFHGYSEDRSTVDLSNIENEKSRFIEGLRSFFENRELVSYSNVAFMTDDGFTKGSIKLKIREGSETYYFTLTIAKQRDKIYPMSISEVTAPEDLANHADKLAEELKSIIVTYYPG